MRIFIIFLLAVFCFSCIPVHAEEWNAHLAGTIIEGPAIVYHYANDSSMPVTRLANDTAVVIMDTYGSWHYIKTLDTNTQGWLQENYFQADSVNYGYDKGMVLCETLSMRCVPLSSAERVGTLPMQKQFTILEEQGDWYYIEANLHGKATKGWVLKEYCAVNFASYIVQGEPLAAYAMPAKDAKRVAHIDPGTQIFILEAFDEYWVISLRGAAAFVRMADLSIFY